MKKSKTYQNDPEIVFKTPWLRVLKKRIKVGGKKSDYYMVDSSKCLVAVLAVDKKNNIFVVHQFRYPVNHKTIDIPGGAVEQGEKPIQAAKRELLEETGLTAKNWKLMFTIYQDSGRSTSKKWVYFANKLEQGKARQEKTEKISTKLVPFKTITKQIMSGKQHEPTLIASVLWYQAKQGL